MKGKEKSDRTTPIGISKEKEYLLIKSATSIKDAPPKKDPEIKSLLFTTPAILKMFGIIIPTNPTIPTKETINDVW